MDMSRYVPHREAGRNYLPILTMRRPTARHVQLRVSESQLVLDQLRRRVTGPLIGKDRSRRIGTGDHLPMWNL